MGRTKEDQWDNTNDGDNVDTPPDRDDSIKVVAV